MGGQAALRVCCLLLIAINMRAPLQAVPQLTDQLRRDLHLTYSEVGLLTAVPVVCFGLASPLVPVLARRWRLAAILAVALFVVGTGSLLRSGPDATTLLVGTALLGLGIAVCNVLLPAVVKDEFPQQASNVMGLMASGFAVGGAIGAMLTLPATNVLGLGWRGGLIIWGPIAMAAAICWLLLSHPPHPAPFRARVGGRGLARSKLAWAVTGYLGFGSLNFFSTTSWLPAYFLAHDQTPAATGVLMGGLNVASVFGAVAISSAAGRLPDQRVLGVVPPLACALGLLLITCSDLDTAGCAVLGLGQGAAISLALVFIVQRSATSLTATSLSSMAQFGGYTLASTGPVLVGWLTDTRGGWAAATGALVLLLVPQIVSSWWAGADRKTM